MSVKNIRIEDFDYPLPEERIALHPLKQRDACKLLVAGGDAGVSHHIFSDLPLLIKSGTLIVANETRVIRARMEFVKDTGARIEVFLLEPHKPHDYVTSFASTESCSWVCMVGNKKRWKEGVVEKSVVSSTFSTVLTAEITGESGGNGYEILFRWDNPDVSFAELVEAAGNMPIPPYLKRESEESDVTDYQTVYSHTEGSVAAPTAGLHFTDELFERLRRHGDEFATVTLHVGAGTFQPVKSEEIGGHPMHSEWISVSRKTLRRLIEALENGRDILAVGTTSVRTLESLPYFGAQVLRNAATSELRVTQWMPYGEEYRDIDTLRSLKALLGYLEENGLEALEATTTIMIAPGFRWRVVNRLITNFHQPKSTLLLLVSSFLGKPYRSWREIYREALEKRYRFLSYGDACLFNRGRQPVRLPASKSMVLRAATIFAVKSPEKLDELSRFNLCDDSEYYIEALKRTLSSVSADSPIDIYIGEGAAPLRFLTAFAASLPSAKVSVTCAEGLRKRPLAPLVGVLRDMGADIVFNDSESEWELVINGKKLRGGRVEADASYTSQFLSALMLASPFWESPFETAGNLPVVSRPYLTLTEEMMKKADEGERIEIEADWSAAAFFYEYAMISGKKVEIEGLSPFSLQGDSALRRIMEYAGVLTYYTAGMEGTSATVGFDPDLFNHVREKGEFEYNLASCPDIVPALAAAFCYRRLPFRFNGVGHLRMKESDRLMALQSILVRLGFGVSVEKDSLVFDGEFLPMTDFPVEIDPFGDHRIAMAFYPLELMGMVRMADKTVVSKSFPDFYQQF